MTLRKSITTAAVVAAMIVPPGAWAGQQQVAPQTPGTAPPVAQAAVTGCAQAHPMAERTIDMTNRRLEAARQGNSPAAMRAAIDDMQAALRQLRTEIAPCAGLPSSAAADPQAGHVMPSTAQTPAMAPPGTPVVRPGSTAPAPAAAEPAAPMDHSKMPMGGAAANNAPAATPMPLAIDPVCGLKVDPSSALRATYQGQTYYFCSEQHRQLFLKDSATYVPKDKR